jgi:hypothetical protein
MKKYDPLMYRHDALAQGERSRAYLERLDEAIRKDRRLLGMPEHDIPFEEWEKHQARLRKLYPRKQTFR